MVEIDLLQGRHLGRASPSSPSRVYGSVIGVPNPLDVEGHAQQVPHYAGSHPHLPMVHTVKGVANIEL